VAICPSSSSEPTGLCVLQDIVASHKRGSPVGIYSICSAHAFVLDAAVRQAAQDGSPLLVESTSNQVNQTGGYTGMTPAAFRGVVQGMAGEAGLRPERLILGGDHLGPYPWRREPAARAMDQARALVRDCVQAGYSKLHLDASIRCADDPPDRPLDRSVVAGRTAELCRVAEEAYRASGLGGPAPCYVVGTEVPSPGGAQRETDGPDVTRVEDAQETIEMTCAAFAKYGLQAAWERVIALVVQPGVEFGDDALAEYDRLTAAPLSRFIEATDRLVFEVHSTDFQTREALRALVEDHFAILKVGPALTFAFREAVFALALVEGEWLADQRGAELSDLRHVLDAGMQARPEYWQDYYTGSPARLRVARAFSYSDRVRYYWPDPAVQHALARLLANLELHPVPPSLLSQFLPEQYERVRAGRLGNRPHDLIADKIRSILADYAWACGYDQDPRSR